MPIIDKDDGTRIVAGGYGDLAIMAGTMEDDPNMGFVEIMGNPCMMTPGEVIAGVEQFLGQPVDALKAAMGFTSGIRLDFRNVESLDLLMHYLRQAREFMVANQK